MNWQSLVIIGIIVVLFIILMIINASANDLDDSQDDEEVSCCKKFRGPNLPPLGDVKKVVKPKSTVSTKKNSKKR